MDKNQSIVLMIIAVLIAGCIFLYFVFRPESGENEMGADELAANNTFDITLNEEADLDAAAAQIRATVDGTMTESERSAQGSTAVSQATSGTVYTSPDTGPGAFALLFAGAVSILIVGYWRVRAVKERS